jgi:AcrR family transcriptional regulator
VAKAMIAEGGEQGFTIREMSRRAKVSVTTVYATFGDKEGLIAAAIEDYYDNLPLSHAPPTTNITVVLTNTDLAVAAILGNKAYAEEYSALYFSRTVDPRIHKVIHDTTAAASRHLDWYQRAMRNGEVVPGLTFEAITTMHANHMMVVLNDWAQARVRDEDLATALKVAFLIMARGVTSGRSQAHAEARLRTILRTSIGAEPAAADHPDPESWDPSPE